MADNSSNKGAGVPLTPLATLASNTESQFRNRYFFPSDDIPVQDKNASWHLGWCQAIWSLFVTGGCYNNTLDYQGIQLLRMYGAGRQPNRLYQDLLLGNEQQNPLRKGWLSTNWKIFSPAPKLHREIRGRFEAQEYDYVATAVDKLSEAKKEDQKWEIWYNSQYGDKEAEVMSMIGAEQEKAVQYIAQSLEELELFKQLGGFKLKSEAELETVLDLTDYISDIKIIKQKFIDDLVDFGKAAYRDYYDPVTGLVKYEYVDWANLVLDYSIERDFKDIRFWGYLKFSTINEVRAKAPEITEEQLIKTAMINTGLWGNMNRELFTSLQPYGYRSKEGVRVYDTFRIPTLVCEWKSVDSEYKVAKYNKAGEKKYYPKTFEEVQRMSEENRKNLKVSRVNNVYQSTWIIGTNYIYDWGKSLNVARPNPKDPKLSIHAVNIPGQAIMESITPVLDQIQLAWVRWQSAIAQAAPAGMHFDLSQLEGVTLGGKAMNLYELIQLKRQTGDTVGRSVNLTNNKLMYQGKPITRNEGGIGEFLNEILITLDKNFRLIAELTGIDVVGAALMQSSSTTATEIKYAAANTVDALQPLFTSWVQAKEDGAVTAALKIQRAIKYNPESKAAYAKMIGEAGVKVLEIGAENSPTEYGIKLEVRPTAEMKQAAIQAATEALKPGKDGEKINLPDWYFFISMIEQGRAKQAIALLEHRLQQSRQQSIDLQRENMQLNGQNMMQQAQAKTQGDLALVQAKGEMGMKEEAVKALLAMNVDNNAALNQVKQAILQQILMPAEQQQPTEPAA